MSIESSSEIHLKWFPGFQFEKLVGLPKHFLSIKTSTMWFKFIQFFRATNFPPMTSSGSGSKKRMEIRWLLSWIRFLLMIAGSGFMLSWHQYLITFPRQDLVQTIFDGNSFSEVPQYLFGSRHWAPTFQKNHLSCQGYNFRLFRIPYVTRGKRPIFDWWSAVMTSKASFNQCVWYPPKNKKSDESTTLLLNTLSFLLEKRRV